MSAVLHKWIENLGIDTHIKIPILNSIEMDWGVEKTQSYPYLLMPNSIKYFYENGDYMDDIAFFNYSLDSLYRKGFISEPLQMPYNLKQPREPYKNHVSEGYYSDIKVVNTKFFSIYNLIKFIIKLLFCIVLLSVFLLFLILPFWISETKAIGFVVSILISLFFLGMFLEVLLSEHWDIKKLYIKKSMFIRYSDFEKDEIQNAFNLEYKTQMSEYNQLKKNWKKSQIIYKNHKKLIADNIHQILNNIWRDKANTTIKCNRTNTPQKRGKTEDLLFGKLIKVFPKYVKIDMQLSSFYPDIVLNINDTYFIDIEIDEPYDLIDRKEIHFLGCNDDKRDDFFTANNWFVLRFSEIQIIDYLQECINLITKLIQFILDEEQHLDFYSSIEYKKITHLKWTKEEARELALLKIRENNYILYD